MRFLVVSILFFLVLDAWLASAIVNRTLCESSTTQDAFDLFSNNMPSVGVWNTPPYLAAVHGGHGSHEGRSGDLLELNVGERMTIVFAQYKVNNAGSQPACTEEIRQQAELVLSQLIDGKHSITPSTFWKQSKLFAHMVVYGKRVGTSVDSKGKSGDDFYQLVKMDTHYISEISSNLVKAAQSEKLNFYWFQFTPPLPATYTLSMDVDFANCEGPLQADPLIINNLSAWNAPVSAENTNGSGNRMLLDSPRTLLKTKKEIAAKANEAKSAAELAAKLSIPWVPVRFRGDKYCIALLAKSVVKLQVKVGAVVETSRNSTVTAGEKVGAQEASMNSKTGVSVVADLFKSGKGVGGVCDLSDLSGSYWIYPTVPITFDVGKLIQHGVPKFHHPRCPSFYSRLNLQRGAHALCMAGDSNSKTTCMQIRQHPKIHPGLSMRCTDFDHKIVMIASKPEAGYTPKSLYNIDSFVEKAKKCLATGSEIVALNIGHHCVDFTAGEIGVKLFKPLVQKLDEVMAKTKVKQQVGLVWATLASHVNDFIKPNFNLTFPISLLIKSNSFREVLENSEFLCSIGGISQNCGGNGSGGGYGPVSLTYTDILSMHAQKDSAGWKAQYKRKLAFVDTFHASLALTSITHNHGDPVQFSSEYFWMHTFIAEILTVANSCFLVPESCFVGSVPVNKQFEYLSWNEVQYVPPEGVPERKHQWPSGYSYADHAARYIFD